MVAVKGTLVAVDSCCEGVQHQLPIFLSWGLKSVVDVDGAVAAVPFTNGLHDRSRINMKKQAPKASKVIARLAPYISQIHR